MRKIKKNHGIRIVFPMLMLLFCLATQADDNTNVFEEQFNTEEDFNKWTQVNGDAALTKTWIFYTQKGNGQARILKESAAAHNNWLISPSIQLEKGKMYELSCYIYSGMYNKQESLRIMLGNSADTVSLTSELLNMQNFVRGDETHKTKRFNVDESGTYHLGFHAYSIANQGRIEVDSIIVKELSLGAVPATADSLTITAAAEGKLSATLSFLAPAIKADSTELSELSSISVFRGDSLIKTFDSPQPGSRLSFTDETAIQGFNTYTVICNNQSGSSEGVSENVYVGLDVPMAVGHLTAKRGKDLSINLAWEAPEKSQNGGYFSESDLKYIVILNGDTLTTTSDRSFTFTSKETAQQVYSFSVVPTVPFGCGSDTIANNVISGQPIKGTYTESFANGKTTDAVWCQDSHAADFKWYATTTTEDVVPFDNDNGMLMARATYAFNDEKSRVMGPILDLSEMTTPVMTFYLYKRTSEDIDLFGLSRDTLKVQLSIDGGDWQDINDAAFSPYADRTGWVKCSIPLLRYAGSNVALSFLATLNSDWGTHHDFFIDSIAIKEAGYAADLAISSFHADTKRVNIGEKTTFTTTVINRGADEATGFDIVLYKDDTEIQRISGNTIAATGSESYPFVYEATLDDALGDSVSWKATIEYANDEIAENNTSDSIWWTVRLNDVQIPQNLSASKTSENSIVLAWDVCTSEEGKTTEMAEPITEDFEGYTPFIIDSIGDWTVIDGDGGKTLNSPVIPTNYAHKGEPMAWQIFNTTEAGVVTETHYDNVFESHSGVQYIMCTSNDDFYQKNDDWLISPRLDGKEQTVSFFARTPSSASGADWIKVYYSTTDKHPDSFRQLGDENHHAIWDGWGSEALTYNLPEGARYFAIRAVRCFLYLMVDDITYRPYNGDEPVRTLVGYNIYRNGEKISSNPVSNNAFTDYDADTTKQNEYKVTAVYEEGESSYSQPAIVAPVSSVSTIIASKEPAEYYTINGTRLQKPTRGAVIMKMKDGSTHKIVVR